MELGHIIHLYLKFKTSNGLGIDYGNIGNSIGLYLVVFAGRPTRIIVFDCQRRVVAISVNRSRCGVIQTGHRAGINWRGTNLLRVNQRFNINGNT